MKRSALFAAGFLAEVWLAVPSAVWAQQAPVLVLPGAGPVTAVTVTRERDGFDQRLRYAGGDGRNYSEIAFRRETADLLLAFPPRLAKPSQFGIESEIAVRFPSQRLTVRPPLKNAYGLVGIALGTDCLYAWQWIEPGRINVTPGSGPPALFQSNASVSRRAISMRIRLCRTAESGLAELIKAVEDLRIALPETRPFPSVATPVRPRRIAPKASAQPARKSVVVEERKNKPAPPPPAVTPAPTPATPPPPVASDQKRYIVSPSPPPPPISTDAGNPRYITDGTGNGPAPKPAPGLAPGDTFFRDLPPAAYNPSN